MNAFRPALVALAAIAGFHAAPAMAQDADTAVNIVYITPDERCPESTDEVITVCGILEDQYRIPKTLRQTTGPGTESWAERVSQLRAVGDFGTLSCSPTGAGGFTGCTQQLIEAAYRDRANAPGRRFSQIIDEARQERLGTIDEAAAAEQARVEQIEREYQQRLERERAGGDADGNQSPPPRVTANPRL